MYASGIQENEVGGAGVVAGVTCDDIIVVAVVGHAWCLTNPLGT